MIGKRSGQLIAGGAKYQMIDELAKLKWMLETDNSCWLIQLSLIYTACLNIVLFTKDLYFLFIFLFRVEYRSQFRWELKVQATPPFFQPPPRGDDVIRTPEINSLSHTRVLLRPAGGGKTQGTEQQYIEMNLTETPHKLYENYKWKAKGSDNWRPSPANTT